MIPLAGHIDQYVASTFHHLQGQTMIHYSCDSCRRILDPHEDMRFVLKVEGQAVVEPLDVEEIPDDRDHLLEIHEILERLDDDDQLLTEDTYHKRHFDLCPECYKKFIKDPFGRKSGAQLSFSQN